MVPRVVSCAAMMLASLLKFVSNFLLPYFENNDYCQLNYNFLWKKSCYMVIAPRLRLSFHKVVAKSHFSLTLTVYCSFLTASENLSVLYDLH